MKRLILKSFLLAGLVGLVCLVPSQVPLWRFHFTNATTESDLLIIPRDTSFDLMLLGTSHGRIFSRAGNHARVERILGMSMINLSKGEGRGLSAEDIYLRYFFERGNHARTIVHLIDPFVFYSDQWNSDNDFLFDEPLDARFFSFLVPRGVKVNVALNYFKSKLAWGWVMMEPGDVIDHPESLATVDPEAVRGRIKSLYLEGEDPATFEKYAKLLEGMVQVAEDHGARVVFVIPASLLGDLPGTQALTQELRKLQASKQVEFFDLSHAITDPHLFYDHDHLNAAGVAFFTERHLKPIVEGRFSIPDERAARE